MIKYLSRHNTMGALPKDYSWETISLTSEQIKNYGTQKPVRGILNKNFSQQETQHIDQKSIHSEDRDSIHDDETEDLMNSQLPTNQ